MINDLIDFVRDIYGTKEAIPLHAPVFQGNEKLYVVDAIDSTFVSSVGKFVNKFESDIEAFTGCGRAVATVNGTAALHAALHVSGVVSGDLVITQSLTFVATCNALHHIGASPVFIDVTAKSLGLCPRSTEAWLNENADISDTGQTFCKSTGQPIKAVVPMHTFGHPVELDELLAVCKKWNLILIEDAAESLGSYYKGQHTGTVGDFGAISFNGNKIITTGGGGMVLCQDESAGVRVKHVTTTAKRPHPYEFYHDEAGFNYRMPNLNAALGCAQMEVLSIFLSQKRILAQKYSEFFTGTDYGFVQEPDYAKSNYWLNAIVCPDPQSRDELLHQTNKKGIMTRPIWTQMHKLPMFEHALRDDLTVATKMESSLVNLPSSSPPEIGTIN